MKISKLFHWLYTILMFLPFVCFIFNLFGQAFNTNEFNVYSYNDVLNLIPSFSNEGGVFGLIFICFEYLIYDVMGCSFGNLCEVIISLLSYWVVITLIWIIFDVLIYVPNLIHKFIDKFSDKVGVL